MSRSLSPFAKLSLQPGFHVGQDLLFDQIIKDLVTGPFLLAIVPRSDVAGKTRFQLKGNWSPMGDVV
jgi:hypothetical protein